MSAENRITRQDFHGHHFLDQCPCSDITYPNLFKTEIIPAAKDLVLMRNNLAHEGLRIMKEFILAGGAQSDCLSEFSAPWVFDSGKFNTGTIVRLHRDRHLRSTYKSIGGYYRNFQKFDQDEPLGIICASPGNKDSKRLLCFNGSDQEIVLGKVGYQWYEGTISLGDWLHHRCVLNYCFSKIRS